MDAEPGFETPSGKGAGGENFPVGSWLLPARLRPHVATYYAIARATDDIADDPDLTAEDKLRRLQAFEDAVLGGHTDDARLAKAHRMRESLAATGLGADHVLDIIAAFKQDATKRRYRDWDDLMAYCNLSAAPVGRYLLDLHGEDPVGWLASDPLCNALQVLNHLQDCKDDYLSLDRVYLPQDWLDAEGTKVEALAERVASPAMRAVLDRALDRIEALMVSARTLPSRLESRRLAMESAVIVRLADRLAARLRGNDPIAGRVALGRWDFARCGLGGIVAGALRRAQAGSENSADSREPS